jgi:hypothetical protein
MKLSFGDLIVPAILVGALGWWGYTTWTDRAEKNHTEQIHQAESAEYRRSVDAMTARHAASPALTDKLAQESHVYTYHVQNALLAASGRAVIVSASVLDLEKRGDGYILYLNDAASVSPAIRYILECDVVAAQKIIGLRPAVPNLTLAATIAVVERMESTNTAPKPGNAAPAQAEADRFVAKGRCLELVIR